MINTLLAVVSPMTVGLALLGNVPGLVNAFGAFTGLFGIALAVYFQLIYPRECPPRYVLTFFVFGSIFILLSGEAYQITNSLSFALDIGGLTLAILAEAYMAFRVRDEITAEPLDTPGNWLEKSNSTEKERE